MAAAASPAGTKGAEDVGDAIGVSIPAQIDVCNVGANEGVDVGSGVVNGNAEEDSSGTGSTSSTHGGGGGEDEGDASAKCSDETGTSKTEPLHESARRVDFTDSGATPESEEAAKPKKKQPLGPIVVRIAVGSLPVAVHIHMRQGTPSSRSPAKKLTARDRSASRERLYKTTKPPRSKSSAAAATVRSPALRPTVERAAALEPSPSMMAAYKVRGQKRAEYNRWATANALPTFGAEEKASAVTDTTDEQKRQRPAKTSAPNFRPAHLGGNVGVRSVGRSSSSASGGGSNSSASGGQSGGQSSDGEGGGASSSEEQARQPARPHGKPLAESGDASGRSVAGNDGPGGEGASAVVSSCSNDATEAATSKTAPPSATKGSVAPPPPQPGAASGRMSPASLAARKKKRRAKTTRPAQLTRRAPVTKGGVAVSRKERYWNLDYEPMAVGTEPIQIVGQPAEGWTGTNDQPPTLRTAARCKHAAMADIQLFAGGTRAGSAKELEVGVPRVTQQWKEGLRQFESLVPLSAEEAEVEALRVMLRRGEGIGNFSDRWTPYTGPDKATLLEKALQGYLDDTEEAEPAAAAAETGKSRRSKRQGQGQSGPAEDPTNGVSPEATLTAAVIEALKEAGLEPSSILEEKTLPLRAAIKSDEDAFTAKKNSLALRLGSVIIEQKKKPKEIVQEWDKKMKGCVNKIDFRTGVRSLGLKANNAQVDALFNEYDDDRGGTLDVAELRSALKTMQEAASKISKEKEAIEERHAVVHEKLERIRLAVDATKAVENALTAEDAAAAEAAKAAAFELQEVVLGEEREQKRLEDEAKAAAEKERLEKQEREEVERAAAEREAAAAAAEVQKRAEEAAATLEPSSDYEEMVKSLKKEITSLDPSKQEKILAQALGAELVKKNLKPMDLVRQWDQKHKGCVTKIEFRQGIRKGMGLKAENKEIDNLFDEFDDDGGGTLDAPELKDALKTMQEAASEAIETEASNAKKQVRVRERLIMVERVLLATVEAEQALRAHAKSLGGEVDKASLTEKHDAALEMKRLAVREQLTLAKQIETDEKAEQAAAAAAAAKAAAPAAARAATPSSASPATVRATPD